MTRIQYIDTVANITAAIHHYSQYSHSWMANWAQEDLEPIVHCQKQSWGNGSYGWHNGMATQAFVGFNVVTLINTNRNLAYVYWHGEFAYILDYSEEVKILMTTGRLPAPVDVDNSELTVVYKVTHR